MAEQNYNEKRPIEAPSDPSKIMLCFKSQDDTELYYRFTADRKIQYLLLEFCKEKNLEYQTVVFLYDGQRIASNRSPRQLGMEDGDHIDVMLHQEGGCPFGVDMQGYAINTIFIDI
ncbi:hypothetical protein Pfo_026733 [Paulownia fortunei]|nr:hypothetical protein Pfo_026733 [Paulownia fortunei]